MARDTVVQQVAIDWETEEMDIGDVHEFVIHILNTNGLFWIANMLTSILYRYYLSIISKMTYV